MLSQCPETLTSTKAQASQRQENELRFHTVPKLISLQGGEVAVKVICTLY